MFKNLSITKKLLLPGLLTVFALMFVISIFWAERLSITINQFQQEEQNLAKTFALPPLGEALWNFDPDQATVVLDGLSGMKGFVGAHVFSEGSVFSRKVMDEALFEKASEIRSTLEESEGVQTIKLGTLRATALPIMFGDDAVGKLIMVHDGSHAKAMIDEANSVAIMIGAAGFFGFSIMLMLISRTVTRPISGIVEKIGKLQNGVDEIDIPEAKRRDEVGHLGRALETLRDTQREANEIAQIQKMERIEQERVVNSLSHGLRKLAQGDVTVVLDEPFNPKYEALRSDFNRTVDQLHTMISSASSRVKAMFGDSDALRAAADDLSRRVETQANTLDVSVRDLEQVSEKVKTSAQTATLTCERMREATEAMHSNRTLAHETVEAMQKIDEHSKKISSFTDLINDIAFQTNLLALNAGVEAARAGAEGGGFGVIAVEVRRLAQRSSEASSEIGQVIVESAKTVTHGVELVSRSGESLDQLSGIVEHVATQIEEISSSAMNDSSTLTDVCKNLKHLDNETQYSAANLEETNASIAALRNDAAGLQDAISMFKLEIGPESDAYAYDEQVSSAQY